MMVSNHLHPPSPHPAGQTLEHELRDLVAGVTSQRNQQVFMRCQGWGGGGRRPLQVAAEEFGVTRERVRQICERTRTILRRRGHLCPILDRTLEYVASRVPMDAKVIEAELIDTHLTNSGFRLEQLEDAAATLGRRVPFVLDRIHGQVLAMPLGTSGVATLVLRAARRCVRRLGAANIEQVAAAVFGQVHIAVGIDLTLQVLRACPTVEWLDKRQGWFWLCPISKNRLARHIQKILSVARRISVSELGLALKRSRRHRGFSQPESVLREVCRRAPGCHLEGDVVVGDPEINQNNLLTGVEEKLVQILQQYGPVLPNHRFRELCVAAGLKPKTFAVYRKYSPVVKEYPGGMCGLRGLG
ncbi:MAG TPA: hypothetical protein VMV94_19745 [Phycisphaerae bacterium]|nr:hypothetical protein [Phycisphaerae bacterium]